MISSLTALAGVVALLGCIAQVPAVVTVYNTAGVVQQPLGTATGSAAVASSSALPAWLAAMPAFNDEVLQPPPVPSPAPPTQFTLGLQTSAAAVSGLSIPLNGSFLGFSIEMSVVTQVIGINSTYLSVPFLNLMALVAQRGGTVPIRVGGNTQEYATLVPSIPDGKAIEKDKDDTSNPTATPTLIFTDEIIYMLNNVSALVDVKWYLGIPFNDTTNLRLGIAEVGEAILGDNLLGFQLGNEPDLYVAHDHRPADWNQTNYFEEFGAVIQAIANDPSIPVRNNLIAPSVSGEWTPESVFDTGFITAYTGSLGALAVEHYPDNNCAAAFPGSTSAAPVVPQDVFPNYLSHTAATSITSAYLDTSSIALASGKPFVMFETNTASCGGFPGVSDSFGAALWGVDYGMTMAVSNFSRALVHVGGVSDTYNPFTPPPTNVSTTYAWSIGPIFYSTLVVAEALGPSGSAQVLDLAANSANIYTPAYAVYEAGTLVRVLLVNFVSDASGESEYTASLGFEEGAAVPEEVVVKYLLAPSVAEKENITWAGQTLGTRFQADGRFQNNETTTTLPCNQTSLTCSIPVPAPAIALVFLPPSSSSSSSPSSSFLPALSTKTFSTTAVTKSGENTASVAPSVLATSNGETDGSREKLASTSKGSSSGGVSVRWRGGGGVRCVVVVGLVGGLLTWGRML